MKERIEQLEKSSLNPRPWELMGEANAKQRPKNSLLELTLDYEQRVDPAPVITDETTTDLEKLIKQRILTGAFDDVVRRVAPNPDHLRSRKQHLNHEKSEQSLAEIYEREFAEQVMGQAPVDKLKKAHTDIQEVWEELCTQLDALTNHQFVPKRVSEDMKITPNAAALTMEEAMPDAVNTDQMLAPEEVYRKPRGELQGEDEMTREDRRRKRATNKRRATSKRKSEEAEKKPTTTDAQATTARVSICSAFCVCFILVQIFVDGIAHV
eukprot:c19418_g1_i1.p1 GENE.c19418_g1_i1~~c19418_g1_i1.p1  ORF type:complete len:300 (+),score=83.58 c19418_g1_i1:100-900(+)